MAALSPTITPARSLQLYSQEKPVHTLDPDLACQDQDDATCVTDGGARRCGRGRRALTKQEALDLLQKRLVPSVE